MKLSNVAIMTGFAVSLAACGSADSAASKASDVASKAAKTVSSAAHVPASSHAEAPSGVYHLERTHAYIVFSYVHQGYSKPMLRWRDWDSKLNWDAETPENSSVTVAIKTKAIDTGVDIFDDHLRAEKWLNVAAFPEATFQSSSITKLSNGHGKMSGDLTLKGITKPVTLDVKFNKAGEGRAPGTHKIGFSATGRLMRSDWDLGAYVPAVSDEVDLNIEVEYIKKSAE